jgi:modulator of drug activity B
MKVFVINAHQKTPVSEGRLNKTMVDIVKEYCIKNNHEFKLTEIEKGYDNKVEVENHIWADVIIAQSPVYWFGTPWIHKKYIDEVFMTGYGVLFESDGRSSNDSTRQYGTGGKLQGKKYMLSLTWNAPENAFDDKNQYLLGGASVEEAFIAHNSVYKFCGAEILPIFSCFDVVKNPNIDKYISGMMEHLEKYIG